LVDFRKNLQHQISSTFDHWQANSSMRTDRQTDRLAGRQADRSTDMSKLILAYQNFSNMPNNRITSLKIDNYSTPFCIKNKSDCPYTVIGIVVIHLFIYSYYTFHQFNTWFIQPSDIEFVHKIYIYSHTQT
jgi:hypothetical protein